MLGMKMRVEKMEADNIAVTLDGAVDWILGSIHIELYQQYGYDMPKRTIMQCTLRDMITLLADPETGFHP